MQPNTNTVFTITPPDLRLSKNGPMVLLLGLTLKNTAPYIKMIDTFFPAVEITYYASDDGITNENINWYRAVAGMASWIIINIDNITTEEVFIALENESSSTTTDVYWVATEKNQNIMLRQLLNSYNYRVFNINELDAHLTEHHI